MIVDNYSRKL